MHAPELTRQLTVALSGAAFLLGAYAAFGPAPAPAAATPPCTCDDQGLRRDVEALTRRVDAMRALPVAPLAASIAPREHAPAGTAGGSPIAVAPPAPALPVETVEVGDGGLVARTRMPDGTVVTTRTGPMRP